MPKCICDFRKRLQNFCRRWQKPRIGELIESVSEELTSIPFYVFREQAEKCEQTKGGDGMMEDDAMMIAGGDMDATGADGEREGETIFQCDEDYIYLGRPLWASSVVHNQTKASWKEMVLFALRKLLGGPMELSKDRTTYAQQALAVLACRVPLRFAECSGVSPQLIAEHMAWCSAVSWDRESVYLTYINEPIIATAAAVLWEKELQCMLRYLIATYGSYMSGNGELGETAACILLIVAVDSAYKNKAKNGTSRGNSNDTDQLAIAYQSKKSSSQETVGKDTSPGKKQYLDHMEDLPRGLSMHGVVTVQEFLEGAFYLTAVMDYSMGAVQDIFNKENELKGHAWVPKSDGGRKYGSGERFVAFVPELMANAEIRFKSIKKASSTVGCRDLPFLFEANVAVLARSGQKGIDILIPLRLRIPRENGRNKTAWSWSCLVIQVKNRKEKIAAYRVAGENLNPVATNAVRCDARDLELCTRCINANDNHFGIVLNVHDGKDVVAERLYGPLWTFISPEAIERRNDVNRKGKKRKLSRERHPEREERYAITKAPASATLVINGLLGGKSERHRSRCPPETVRQIENLLAHDTLLGVMRTKTQKQMSALDKLINHASQVDDNYVNLKSAVDSAKQRIHDIQKIFEKQDLNTIHKDAARKH